MAFRETTEYFYFNAECSNENIDVEGQIILQKTLLDSKGYFLKNGVISVDHKHRKHLPNTPADARYVIGWPVSVYTKGKSTWVKGKIVKSNPLARVVIELLRRGSNKIRSSIGGTRPQVTTINGRQFVTALLWDDVSLTATPVNNSLQPAKGIKKSTRLVVKF
jgi:hypothetical protein